MISHAVQRGSSVYAYNENNRVIFSQSAGGRPGDGLKGYTSSSLSIQKGSILYTYNEKGRQIGSTIA